MLEIASADLANEAVAEEGDFLRVIFGFEDVHERSFPRVRIDDPWKPSARAPCRRARSYVVESSEPAFRGAWASRCERGAAECQVSGRLAGAPPRRQRHELHRRALGDLRARALGAVAPE